MPTSYNVNTWFHYFQLPSLVIASTINGGHKSKIPDEKGTPFGESYDGTKTFKRAMSNVFTVPLNGFDRSFLTI